MENEDLQWIRGRCIGKGSFGTVSLATSTSNGQIFAVKSVNSKLASSYAIQSLENEIRTLKSLTSPYIVRYLGDDWTHGSQRNLHMEYVAGGTLADLAAESKLDEHVIRRYTQCILRALLCIHSRGIVHCDIKGKNVLVDTSGTVKLADFGAARRVSGGEGLGAAPRGTPLWMAPEVVRLEAQSPDSDVWSLGCTVVEMATGRPPWTVEGNSPAATMFSIGFGDRAPEFPVQLSELGKDFLDKCLRIRASERWTSRQLLDHPFISDIRITNPSPRSVLDVIDFNFQENRDADESDCDVVEEVLFNSVSNFSSDGMVTSARERIRRLATDREIIWDSDGWEEVRLNTVIMAGGREEAARDREQRQRINLEYFNTSSVGEESCEGNVSFSGAICRGMISSCWGWRLFGGGLGCQHGSKQRPLGMIDDRLVFFRCKLYFVFLAVEMHLFLFLLPLHAGLRA